MSESPMLWRKIWNFWVLYVFTYTFVEPLQLAFCLLSANVLSLSSASGAHALQKDLKPERKVVHWSHWRVQVSANRYERICWSPSTQAVAEPLRYDQSGRSHVMQRLGVGCLWYRQSRIKIRVKLGAFMVFQIVPSSLHSFALVLRIRNNCY